MQAASTRRRKKPPLAAVVPKGASPASRRAPVLEEVIDNVRQDYLDALPIAAAVIAAPESQPAFVDAANAHFRRIGGSDKETCGTRIDRVPFLQAGPIGCALTNFLNGETAAHEFEGHDGQTIGGRHFTVRLARLGPRLGIAKRCLISMIDKTAQVETEKSLRAEMLRDTLTGLPNRLAFNERVEEILDIRTSTKARTPWWWST